MKIVLASDHNGVAFKELLKEYLVSKNYECVDIGSFGDEKVDYPDYGIPAAEMVARGEADRAILICGTGIGMAMAANKVCGIRAALCLNPEAARLSRRHNDANILALTGWQIEQEDIYSIVDNFLDTSFEGGRHKRRVDKIMDYDEKARRGRNRG
ncbi:MAG: ribose 5-phosphate isomerase B [Candidatus Latescibacteria bacterium]|nr:ribose 5-phosphate isomerase B [Candidatus Latescibacterota bacterium]NIO01014.1 ribose 5-phosphate isomerase B [Candidatus Latescibacterota bacterium]NIO27413.1 ribose 5-phosphate isomerase B [Candidatus Latescibacterota bacterium]NIO54935.1 ribose 5-phosphate isomerase B [Candidatus Latescibacterota bacterium]NIT01024.1 ribose 5-phosphate isomerase B [Candidatus Latescibacterota bacterium]